MTGPTGTTNAIQLSQEPTNGCIGVGTNGYPINDIALTVSNVSFPTAPANILLAVYNKINSPLPSPAVTPLSFAVFRTNPSYTSDPALDMGVDNNGNIGFGTLPSDFFPGGTHFGIVQTDNTSTLPLFTTYTNTNNTTGLNLPAIAVDYKGRVAMGAVPYFPLSSQLFLTDPIGDGASLMAAYTHAGDPAFFIKNDGMIGIGNDAPAYQLDVTGDAAVSGDIDIAGDAIIAGDGDVGDVLSVGTTTHTGLVSVDATSQGAYAYGNVTKGTNDNLKALAVQKVVSGVAADKFVVYGNGNTVIYGKLQIGTQKSGATLPNAQFANYQLSVDGQIAAKELIVQVMSWSDTVFSNGYRLRSLPEVESYVKTNGHLPEVPDERDVMENGVSVGVMNATLLKKVEELTLYAVQQQKEIEQLKAQLNSIIK